MCALRHRHFLPPDVAETPYTRLSYGADTGIWRLAKWVRKSAGLRIEDAEQVVTTVDNRIPNAIPVRATLQLPNAEVRTSASAICRLEDADYNGHSLYMLKRIAEALDKRVEIRFVPVKKLHPAAATKSRLPDTAA